MREEILWDGIEQILNPNLDSGFSDRYLSEINEDIQIIPYQHLDTSNSTIGQNIIDEEDGNERIPEEDQDIKPTVRKSFADSIKKNTKPQDQNLNDHLNHNNDATGQCEKVILNKRES